MVFKKTPGAGVTADEWANQAAHGGQAKKPAEGKVAFQVRIPADVYRELKRYAEQSGKSINDVVAAGILPELEKRYGSTAAVSPDARKAELLGVLEKTVTELKKL